MREERLLERIRRSETEPVRRAREDSGRIIDSVLRHLQRILNTRQGSVPIAEDYGIPDFTDIMRGGSEAFKESEPGSLPETFKDFERSLKRMIMKYEPRLKYVRINFVPLDDDPISIHFNISASVSVSSQNIPVAFEAVYSDGRIEVRG